jgi:RNA-binding protein
MKIAWQSKEMLRSTVMKQLAGFQRKYLRGLVHGQRAIVQVGQNGLTDAVIAAVDQALLDHELIKVRMHEPDDKKQLAEQLAQKSDSTLCGLIGHQAILFRHHPKKPRIVLPKRQTETP